MLAQRDRDSTDSGHVVSYWRHRYASATEPNFLTGANCVRDPSGAEVKRDIELPEWIVRQQWLSQDPLASVHYYIVIMKIQAPAAFGLWMCMRCPDCNADCQSRFEDGESCSDYMGSNHKSMGGFAGIATAMAFANEFQGDGTAHGLGLLHSQMCINTARC